MQANSTDNKTFQLTDNGQLLGELNYENIFYLKAEIKVGSSESYPIRPVGFFGTSITVSKDGAELVNLKMNWRGQIVFSFQNGEEYLMKSKGLLSDKFVIENKESDKLIQFDPKFNWSKFKYNYEITFESVPQNVLMILLGVYAANYYIASMSGAIGGI